MVAALRAPGNADKAVILVGGGMLERLHERMARRILETAEEIRAIEAGPNRG